MQREACRYLYLHQFGGAAPAQERLLQHQGAAQSCTDSRAAAAADPEAARRGSAAGVYADLSTVPLHSMEALIKAHQLALASVARDASSSESLSTSWLASSRRHPFWFFTFAQVIRGSGGDLEGCVPDAAACSRAGASQTARAAARASAGVCREGAQHNTTGALMLRRALSVYRDAEGRGVDILEPECFHANTSRSDLLQHADKPYMELAKFCNPKDQDFEKATCQSYFPSAYIVEV